jgi:Holliday junction resolvase-like predicted endonuclease
VSKKLFKIIKGNGDTEYFQSDKLKHSLKRAGADAKTARRIIDHIENELEDGMKTMAIYDHAFDLLKKTKPSMAAKYDLKKALLRLGPSGYPFEKFVAKLWEKQGYQTQVGQMVSGQCIEHEVDVIAENEHEVIMMECKYHNYHNVKSDIKTALYVHARMQDLKAHWESKHGDSKKTFKGCLVTNTQFSHTAIKYAECVGLDIVAWSYPAGKGLGQLIDKVGLHPITCLTTLTEEQSKKLLNDGHVLCKDVAKGIPSLRMKKDQREKVLQEAEEVCQLQR